MKANANSLPSPADQIVARFIHELVKSDSISIEGIYLTGSITLKDFYPQKSDIDFLVILKDLPEGKYAGQLKEIHSGIGKQMQGPKLSGYYITQRALIDHHELVLSYNEGKWRTEKFKMAPIYLFELKSNGIPVYGNYIESLPIKITEDEVNEFLFANINAYWKEWIRQHSSLLSKKLLLQLFPRLTEWVILGVARQFYTLHTGKIASKKDAGLWIRKELPVKYHAIVDEAIRIRSDIRTNPFTGSYGINLSFSRADQTIDCVHYMIELFNRAYTGKREESSAS